MYGVPKLPLDYECGNCGSRNLRVYQEIYTQQARTSDEEKEETSPKENR